MTDISNITHEVKNLKTIKGCTILNLKHKYFKQFTVTLVKHNGKSHFNSPFAMCHCKVFKIGVAIIFS